MANLIDDLSEIGLCEIGYVEIGWAVEERDTETGSFNDVYNESELYRIRSFVTDISHPKTSMVKSMLRGNYDVSKWLGDDVDHTDLVEMILSKCLAVVGNPEYSKMPGTNSFHKIHKIFGESLYEELAGVGKRIRLTTTGTLGDKKDGSAKWEVIYLNYDTFYRVGTKFHTQ